MHFQIKNLYIAQIILIAIIAEIGSTDIILTSLSNIQKFYSVSTNTITVSVWGSRSINYHKAIVAYLHNKKEVTIW